MEFFEGFKSILSLPNPILQLIGLHLDARSLACFGATCHDAAVQVHEVLRVLKSVSFLPGRGSRGDGLPLITALRSSTCVLLSREADGMSAISMLGRRCTSLVYLDLKNAFRWVDDAVLKCLSEAGPQTLRTLVLDHCDKITDQGLQALCSHHSLLHGLATLSIKSCGFRLGSGSSLAGLKHLTHLEAPWATSFTSAGLAGVCPRLVHANFQGCDLLDDHICQGMTEVHTLNLAFTSVGDRGLAMLAQGSPKLASLYLGIRNNNIYTTGHYSEAALLAFARTRPDIYLHLISA